VSPLGRRLRAVALAALPALLRAAPCEAQSTTPRPADMRPIRAGTYVPFYRLAARPTVRVRAFLLDARPVTNAAFLDFVRANPAWQRALTRRLFADGEYLSHWATDLSLGPQALPEQPVTRVSWFAARAFCRAMGRRLPTEAEWEYVARASERAADAPRDPATLARITAWYGHPGGGALPRVGAGRPDYWGLHDVHGLIWEWVEDFNSALVVTDSRDTTGPGAARFCGAASLGARDTRDYVAFMRYAFRQSLRGSYTVPNLGFRCAMDAPGGG
jgi:formylglycine-generating enzyme